MVLSKDYAKEQAVVKWFKTLDDADEYCHEWSLKVCPWAHTKCKFWSCGVKK